MSQHQQYGTAENHQMTAAQFAEKQHCQHTINHLEHVMNKSKRELPQFWFMGCTLVPIFIFMLINWVRSADVHYKDGIVSLVTVILTLFLILVICVPPVFRTETKKKCRYVQFVLFTSLLAWWLGLVMGDFNYQRYFRKYFDYTNLEHYPNTDPTLYHGQQFLDAATIQFAEGSHLDLKGGFGFKNGETYCVAPIVSPLSKLGSFQNFDFWAIGKNCCSGHVADFKCGEYNNPSKWMSGLRLLNDKDRNYYRLAVEGACAASSITARYPVFFHWMENPQEEINSFIENGWAYYLRESVSFVLLQFILTILALIAFI